MLRIVLGISLLGKVIMVGIVGVSPADSAEGGLCVRVIIVMSELSVFLRQAKRSNKKELDLSLRELSFIPKDVFSIRTLEELNLSNNNITAIEPAIADLFRLKVLNLDNNALTDLPAELLQLPKLALLSLKGNPLPKKF